MATWIKSGSFTGSIEDFVALEPGDSDPFEMGVRQCIKAWLSHQSVFTFQTSGSTGEPKSITFRREQLIASARMTLAAFGLRSGQTSLVCLDVKLIAGFMMIIRSLEGEMNIILQSPSANPLQHVDEQIDFIAMVPYQLSTILNDSKENLNRLKTAIVGGAPLSSTIIDELQAMKPAFYATYGMTETITHVALQPLNGPKRSAYFQFLPTVSGRTDGRGCLIIQVPHLDAPVVTNDIVEFSDNNHFKVMGRLDEVINSGGVKMHPEQLEQKLSKIFKEIGINQRFVIIGLPEPKLGTAVSLVLEGEPNDLTITTRVLSAYTKSLSRYEFPKSIHYLKTFPETASQKIDRSKIRSILIS